MKNLSLIFILCFIFSLSQAQIDLALQTELLNILESRVENSGNKGVSAHLILADGKSWSGTAGVGKQMQTMTDATLFHGASTTKLNVAILMLLLAEEGLVDLDDPWKEYLSLPLEIDTNITVRQLLNHSSGIADYLETSTSGALITEDFNRFFTPESIMQEVVPTTPLFAPGTGFRYSNSNYVMAGLIIEAVTGHPVHVELRERIWDPLNMDHTYFGAYEDYDEPMAGIWWNFGSGQTNYSNEPTTSMLSFAYGAGNIVSCPKDLASLLDALFKGFILSEDSMQEMQSFIPNSYSSWTAGYGLGLHHFSNAQDRVLGHDGYYTNLTDLFYSTTHGFTLATMSNTQTEWFGVFTPMYESVVNHLETTTIDNLVIDHRIKIFPNPSSDRFNIQCQEVIKEIEVLDLMGKLVLKTSPGKKATVIAVNTPGIYYVHIHTTTTDFIREILIK